MWGSGGGGASGGGGLGQIDGSYSGKMVVNCPRMLILYTVTGDVYGTASFAVRACKTLLEFEILTSRLAHSPTC